jgi:mRNA interferase MazF
LERGEIWTSASGRGYGSKPRPVVIIQYAGFQFLDSVTFCGLTRDTNDLPFFRVLIEPTAENGLEFPSRIMADRILTTDKSKLGYRIGRLGARDVARLNQALLVFLGLVA